MSTWEDLDSSSSYSDKEAHVGLMPSTVYNSTSKESDEEVDLFDIPSLRVAYQEAIFNNATIIEEYKEIKRKYKKMHVKKVNH